MDKDSGTVRRRKPWHCWKRGSAAIEFGLLVPLLVTLLLGCAELGFFIQQTMAVNNAVEAGITLAAKKGFDAAAISSAVLNGASLPGLQASPAPTVFCGCVVGGVVTQSACDVKCSNSLLPGHYARIGATVKAQTIMPTAMLPLPDTIAVQMTTRLN
jgi:TadE-like protein